MTDRHCFPFIKLDNLLMLCEVILFPEVAIEKIKWGKFEGVKYYVYIWGKQLDNDLIIE